MGKKKKLREKLESWHLSKRKRKNRKNKLREKLESWHFSNRKRKKKLREKLGLD